MERCLHPFPAFSDGLVTQANDLHPHFARGDHDLYIDGYRFDAIERNSADMRNHRTPPCYPSDDTDKHKRRL
ncbi:hypothetical protein GCM10011385_08860 [Nitratireductor aestuarii]|uniref:Uncharacterized protein n=1 Tax=Nitratireductor aestuarii TaxID=1735103 RepID=A0A916RI72_9HYPH|nr:hypothetical protein GCM10011385_08860 [Nitratireductor aestuarii]